MNYTQRTYSLQHKEIIYKLEKNDELDKKHLQQRKIKKFKYK